jgi:hypothetical protein
MYQRNSLSLKRKKEMGMKEEVEAAGGVWTTRRPGIERVLADVIKRKPWLNMADAMVQAKALYTSQSVAHRTADGVVVVPNPHYLGGRTSLGRVAGTQQATPPMGPPAVGSRGGNSAPVLAPVAGVEKSERVGERGRAK